MSAFVEAPDPFPRRTACLFDGCSLSVEEHHRLARGYAAEAQALRARAKAPDVVDLTRVTSDELLAELKRRLP